MPDMNKVVDRLKAQKPIGANRDGTLMDSNPGNDGTVESRAGQSTMNPKLFFV